MKSHLLSSIVDLVFQCYNIDVNEARCFLKYKFPTNRKKERNPLSLVSFLKSASDPSMLDPDMNWQFKYLGLLLCLYF